jgi:hypothetical protein
MAQPDIIVYSPENKPTLIVQIKAIKEGKPDELERTRQALMDAYRSSEASHYLVIQRNGIFLWKKGAAAGTLPEHASLKSVLREYAASISDPELSLRRDGLEMVVRSWLDDLTIGIRSPKSNVEADQLLVSSGIYKEIRDGRVESEFQQ